MWRQFYRRHILYVSFSLSYLIVDVDYSTIFTSHYFKHVFRITIPKALRHFHIDIALATRLYGFGTVTVDGCDNVIGPFVFNVQANIFPVIPIQRVGRVKPCFVVEITAVDNCAKRCSLYIFLDIIAFFHLG